MNYVLKNIPVRTSKPRNTGFTMAMDKGLSLRETEDFVEGIGIERARHKVSLVQYGLNDYRLNEETWK